MKKLLYILVLVSSFSFAQNPQEKINQMLDNWHQAAAVADEDTFFGSMTQDARYIGTDETENWSREELRVWSEEYFAKDSAWDFKKKTRNVYTNKDENLAWFDETLDTWMGVCRGSGVMVLTKDGWKIQHYVLSITVPNDKIDAYLELK